MFKGALFLSTWAFCLMCLKAEKHLKLPSYIQPCSKSAPDFEECCSQHAREALAYLLKGDKEYNVPVLDPLVLPSLELNFGDLKLALKDLYVYGLDKVQIKQVKFDLNNNELSIKLHDERISLVGKYIGDGKILMLPVQGEGNMNITILEPDLQYHVNYDLKEIGGDVYIKFSDKAEADLNIKKSYIDFENLFGDNKELGDITNKALNDEWDKFFESIKPFITKTIIEIAQNVADRITTNVPLKYVFVD